MDTTESRTFADRLAELLRDEQHAMADFLVALAAFDQRRGWIALGHASLFAFLTQRLLLSKAAAFFRMKAAELIQRHPSVIEPLRDGRLCLTTVASLARVITTENQAELLPRFFHRSKQEAKAIAAELLPAASPPRRTVITAVPASTPRTAPAPAETTSQRVFLGEPESTLGAASPPPPAPAEATPVLRVEPLTASERRVHLTVSPGFLEKLEQARLALSHSLRGATVEDVLSIGLDLILDRDRKRKGLVANPRPAPAEDAAEPGASYIPAAVRREVWQRDKGRCQWKLDSGGICGSRLRVELDHVRLRCRGAKPIASELRLLCRSHNDLAARQALGDGVMDRYTRKRTAARRT
jgi:hypothetical protein